MVVEAPHPGVIDLRIPEFNQSCVSTPKKPRSHAPVAARDGRP